MTNPRDKIIWMTRSQAWCGLAIILYIASLFGLGFLLADTAIGSALVS